MKKKYLILVSCLQVGILKSELPMVVVLNNMNCFLYQVVAQTDRQAYAKFYESFIIHEGELTYKKNERTLEKHKRELIELGLCSLEVRQPELFKRIKSYLDSTNKKTKQQVHRFLYRFGTYEKYLQQKSSFSQPILVRARKYANEFKNHVVSFAHRLDIRRFFNR